MARQTPAQRVHASLKQLERRIRATRLVAVLLGAGGDGLELRIQIARRLSGHGIIGLIPEVDFPKEIGPSLIEPLLLAGDDIDLVFLYIESVGSSAELGMLHGDSAIARKLRIIVPGKYHPLFGDPAGFLQDLYMTHLAVLGHVYPADSGDALTAPAADDLIVILAKRYQRVKALNPVFIK